MYTQALACVKTSPLLQKEKEIGDLLTKVSQALNRLQMEAYIIHVFYYYVERSRKPVPGVRDSGVWRQGRERETHPTPPPRCFFLLTFPCAIPTNRLLSRPRAIALLSSEPCAASENVKLCKLMVKRMRDFFARALACTRSSQLRRSPLTRVLDLLWVKKNKRLLAV